jgi:hypothetical protein
MRQQNDLASGQAAAACPREPSWHDPSLEEERILMMDYAPA